MKKRIVMSFIAALLAVSAVGCGDPSKLTSKKNSEAEAENPIIEESVVEEPATDVSDGNSDNLEQTEEQGAAVEQNVETAENPEVSAGDTASAVSAEGVSFDPEEIVEPEIPQEEVQQPVEVPAEEPVEQQPAEAVTQPVEEDNFYDIVFIGDSQFDNARGTGSDIPAYTCSLLGKNVKFYNLAIGGTAASLSRDMGIDLATFDDSCFVGMSYAIAGKIKTDFLDQYPAGAEIKKVDPKKVDLYIIEYGANDYINGKDLFNQDYEFDVHTYNGALAVGLGELRNASPNAKFIICGPSYCLWYNASGYVIGDSYTVSKGIAPLSEYSNTASNLANSLGYEFMDTMYASQFDLKIETVDDYLSDGLHYNEKGRQIYAAVLAHKIQKLRGLDDSEMPYLEINSFDFWSYRDTVIK